MRLFFQENEWALSTAWSKEPPGFFPPELTDVSNLGHPLFRRIAVPHVVLDFGLSPGEAAHRVPIDAAHFHCAVVEMMANGSHTLVKAWPGPRAGPATPKDPPARLSGGLSRTVYGHTARNDLSLWGSEYVGVLYELRDAKLGKLLNGGEEGPHYLRIELLFQFGPYSSEPPHEPSGMLNSARLIPAVSFDTDSPHLRRLRFDVQCEPRLESLDPRLKGEEFPAIAILTRDSESLDLLAPASKGVGGAPFDRIEKPVVFEICSTGWRPGGQATNVTSPPGESGSGIAPAGGTPQWDNVHVAPGKCDGHDDWVPKLPSAPGAYYALHCHWRWGAILSDYWYLYNNSAWWRALESAAEKVASKTGPAVLYMMLMDALFHTLHPDGRDAQYRGLPITANAGGPLFDPNLPHQTLQFAIAKSDHAWLSDQIAFEFVRDFLVGKSADPEFINGGETLSWWLSAAVERPRSALRFGGTLFAHGIHFAHNLYEPTGLLGMFGPDGSQTAPTWGRSAYIPPRAPKAWER